MVESKGVSMLDRLSGNIVATKAAAGAKLSPGLTPVAGERPMGLPNTPATFPFDVPQIVLVKMIATLEEQVINLDGIIYALKLLAGDPAAVEATIVTDKATTQRLLEREADRRVADATKVAAGDKAAAKRVAAEVPMAEVIASTTERDAKRAAVLAAMMDGPDTVAGMLRASEVAAETFETKFAEQQKVAQAAAFTQPSKVVPAVTGDGWSCPEHGITLIEPRTSPRGRTFLRCAVAGCREFEKV